MDERGVPFAEEEVVNTYFDAHPEALKFKTKSLDFQE
jgi:hypothetical protein